MARVTNGSRVVATEVLEILIVQGLDSKRDSIDTSNIPKLLEFLHFDRLCIPFVKL
jgi:hypothetical protein